MRSKGELNMDGGVLSVSRKVIRRLVHRELRRFPEIIQVGGDSIFKRFYGWLGLKPRPRGVYVEMGEGEIALSVTLVLVDNIHLPNFCSRVRKHLTELLESVTGFKIRTIHIHVPSIKGSSRARRSQDDDALPPPKTKPRFEIDTDDDFLSGGGSGRFEF